jgi:hypothetical protein
MEVVSFGCSPWRWYRCVGKHTYEEGESRGIVGEERRGKEMDGCPLTETSSIDIITLTLYYHPHPYTIALVLIYFIKYISKILEI